MICDLCEYRPMCVPSELKYSGALTTAHSPYTGGNGKIRENANVVRAAPQQAGSFTRGAQRV